MEGWGSFQPGAPPTGRNRLSQPAPGGRPRRREGRPGRPDPRAKETLASPPSGAKIFWVEWPPDAHQSDQGPLIGQALSLDSNTTGLLHCPRLIHQYLADFGEKCTELWILTGLQSDDHPMEGGPRQWFWSDDTMVVPIRESIRTRLEPHPYAHPAVPGDLLSVGIVGHQRLDSARRAATRQHRRVPFVWDTTSQRLEDGEAAPSKAARSKGPCGPLTESPQWWFLLCPVTVLWARGPLSPQDSSHLGDLICLSTLPVFIDEGGSLRDRLPPGPLLYLFFDSPRHPS